MSNQTPHPDEPTFVRITNNMVWTKLLEIESKLIPADDYAETKRRVKSLEMRFYGILAGLLAALTTVALITRG